MNEDNVRFTRPNKEKENKEIEQRFKNKIKKAAEEINCDVNDINLLVVNDQVIRNPYKYKNHNKYCGKEYWV